MISIVCIICGSTKRVPLCRALNAKFCSIKCYKQNRRVLSTAKALNKHGLVICQHEKTRTRCRLCRGGSICQHGDRRYVCRSCSPLGWAKKVLRDIERHAINGNYAPAKIIAENLVKLSVTSKTCVLCEEPLLWNNATKSPALHHNHVTGEVVGFAHSRCNSFEGFLESLPLSVRRKYLANASLVSP